MNPIRELFFGSPAWGLVLTLLGYYLGMWIQKKTGLAVLQPILTGSAFIVVVLLLIGADFEEYSRQNMVLDYFLSLTAVVLAVPLYRSIYLLKKYMVPILTGVVCGTVAGMATVVIVGRLMGTDMAVLRSMIPKNATTAIGVPVAQINGGIPSITLALIMITGITGAVCGPELLKLMGVKNPIAKGISIGTVSHAAGTSRAFREGEIIGAMSSLAIALAGTLTAFLAPIFTAYFL